MKSLDPLDARRLHITDVDITHRTRGLWADDVSEHDADDTLRIVVTLTYDRWWSGPGADMLWEKANALTCLRDVFVLGGVLSADGLER